MYQEKRKDYGPRRNEYIRVPQVQLIGSKGENIGVVDTAKALSLAKEVGLDLVEVGAGINPPVCKIMDYSKYIYIQNKKTRQNKKGKIKETKEFRFSPVIDRADIDHRVKRSKEFLEKGHNVRIVVVKKGRQTREQAMQVFNDILTNFTDYSSIESESKFEGNRIFLTFKPNGKTK
ncbi:translation initiation factor IF-3, partial [Candidatus Microgenomates bacterium]|nr:translation initiation factor IF-3 [Candidatus Microgenomates bacterium]